MKEGSSKSPEPKQDKIDWGKIRNRINDVKRILEPGSATDAETRTKILRERARALAKVPERRNASQELLDIVEFGLANETYAVETSYVREVYPLKELTPIPGTPAFVSGIITVRGQILSVIDMKKFFALPEKGIADLHKVIVVGQGAMELGILADDVFGVRAISLSDIGQPLFTLTGVRAEYLKGVTKEALIILDAGKILSDPKIVVHE